MTEKRREFLFRMGAGGLLLTPLAAMLSACGGSDWPDGMVEIKWDRDTCVRCSMAISDRRFAAEICGGPRKQAFKFDDIGCMLFWMRDKMHDHPWMAGNEARFWVGEVGNSAERMRWLDPRVAHYVEKTSPMGYNYGAVSAATENSLDFESMRRHVLAMGR